MPLPGQHHMQRNRKRNIIIIQKMMSEMEEPIDKDVLIRKCQLVIGCTKNKAIEYIEVIIG